MTPQKDSTPRWPLALAAMVVVPALIALLVLLLRDRVVARVATVASASATAAFRPAPLIPVAARPRAGVAGRVLDGGGQPVAGATVCAFVQRSATTTTAETRAPRCVPGGTDGAYTLADLPSGTTLVLSASAAGFLPQPHASGGELRLAEGEQRTGVDFAMRSGGVEVRGRVADATGGVVPGALVASEAGEGLARAIATTDGKGEFSLWVGPGTVHLGATATGYAPGRTQGPAPGHFFSIYLVPGATLIGRAVVAGTETPVAAARIEAIQVEGGSPRATTSTEVDGRFRVEGLAPGRYRIEATSEGREGYSHSSITLLMGETSPETIVELDPAYVVKGRVIVKGTGAPCTKGAVRITDRKQSEFSEGAVGADGAVRMASVIPGNYEVEVECEGHISQEKYAPIVVVDRDVAPQTWEVEQGSSVRVAVVDPAGKSITEARVSAVAMSETDGSSGSTSQPETDGTFVVRGLRPGTFRVSVSTPEGTRGNQENVIVDAVREERIKIELPFVGAIEGLVQDPDHRPVANVTVQARGPRGRSTQTLDDGTFVLAGLPAGEYTVTAQNAARGVAESEDERESSAKVTVSAPGRAKTTITLSKRLGVIAGKVVDADGQPITDAFIEYGAAEWGIPRRRSGAPVVTDTEGHFTIEGLVDGDYNLRAYRKGGGEGTADHVKAGNRGVALRIGPGASIAGTLSSPKGGVERFELSVREKKTMFSRAEMFFHAGGNFSLRDLPPGTYDLVAETPEGSVSAEVTLAEGEQKTGLALAMAMRGTVEGRLLAAEGNRPLAGVRIRVFGGKGGVSPMAGEEAVTGADGGFHLDGVLSGSWMISLSPKVAAPEVDFSPVSVEISASGATNLGEIRLPARPKAEPEEGIKE